MYSSFLSLYQSLYHVLLIKKWLENSGETGYFCFWINEKPNNMNIINAYLRRKISRVDQDSNPGFQLTISS